MRLRCRVSLEVRSLLSPALGTPTELREARAEGEERGRAGVTHRSRWSAAALCLRPRRRRSRPGCSSPVAEELQPAPRQSGSGSGPAPTVLPPPRLRLQPRPFPGPRPPPAAVGGGIENPREPHRGPSIWDPNQEAASPEQPGSCTSCVEPGPGAAWPSRRAPALQGPCRSRSWSSLLQGWGSPQGPVPEEEMAGIGALSELR